MRKGKFGTLYHREYYRKRRQEIIEYLGGQCINCNTTQDLQFDHKDKKNKTFSISRKMSLKNNKNEIDKCQLLCKPCHEQKTAIENSGFTHGTMYGFWKKRCKCTACITAKELYAIKRNIKRRRVGEIGKHARLKSEWGNP